MTDQMPLLEFAARTDVGAFRQVNEDSHLAASPVFLVADGVGGHEAGDLASQAAIAAFNDFIGAETVTFEAVGSAYAQARHTVNDISAGCEKGAGTTLTGLFLTRSDDGFAWLIINVGDSRVYRYRDARLQQITVDHTLRNEMLARGMAEDDPRLPAGNIITRALGSGIDRLDTWLLPLTAGDRLLICSDGLTDTLSINQIFHGLAQPEVNAAADNLLKVALELQPRDNVTLIVVDVIEPGKITVSSLEDTSQTGEIPITDSAA